MNFNIVFQIVLVGQRWAALKEVFAAPADAVRKGYCRITRRACGACSSTLFAHSMAWIVDIIETTLSGRQTD
jgi:hypothetical protein